MPFIPHTEDDVQAMLKAIGADSIDDLFDEIPAGLRISELAGVPEALSEMEIVRLMRSRSLRDRLTRQRPARQSDLHGDRWNDHLPR